MTEIVLGYIPCKNEKQAKKIGKTLVEKRMIACANIIPVISSCYKWKGKVCEEKESLLLIKTVKAKKKILRDEIKRLHSYKLPCVAFISFDEINKEYEQWVKKNSY